MTRRGNGDGSICRRKDDGKWVAYLRVNGKKKYFYDDTQTGVTKKLRAAQREMEQGTLATGPNQTVKLYLEHWLEVRRSTVKASTYISNRSYLSHRVIPAIGHIKLQKVTGDHIQSLYTQLLKDGLLPNTVRLIHFKAAYGWQTARAMSRGIQSRYEEIWYVAPFAVRKQVRRECMRLVEHGAISPQEAGRLVGRWYPLAETDEEIRQEALEDTFFR